MISILVIPFGRLSDTRGRMRFYATGVVVFGLGSLAAAVAPSGAFLIAARCVQGAGAALLGATSAAIITAVFPPTERARALGLNGMAVYLGLTAGPPLGGLLVTHFGWRWIFLVNVPIALATLVAGRGLLAVERRDRLVTSARAEIAPRGARIDIPGAVLLGVTLATLFVPLTFSPFWGWADTRTIGLLAASAVFLTAFVVVEDRVEEPLLHLDLLRRNRLFAAANVAALLQYAAMYGVTVFTAVFLEIVQDRSAQHAGLVLLAQPVLMVLLSPFAGRLSDRVGSRSLATTGMLLTALGMVELALLPAGASTVRILPALATVGMGMAGFSAPNTSAVMGSVERSQLSLASGFLGTMRFAGQAISVALLGAIAASRLGPTGGRIIFQHSSGGHGVASAFAAGYRDAMFVGAELALAGAITSLVRGKGLDSASTDRRRPASRGWTREVNFK